MEFAGIAFNGKGVALVLSVEDQPELSPPAAQSVEEGGAGGRHRSAPQAARLVEDPGRAGCPFLRSPG